MRVKVAKRIKELMKIDEKEAMKYVEGYVEGVIDNEELIEGLKEVYLKLFNRKNDN
jgi:hypothetical protein